MARVAQGRGLVLTRRNLSQKCGDAEAPIPPPADPVPSREVHFLQHFNSTPAGELFTVPALEADAQGQGQITVVQDPLTQFRADGQQVVSIRGLHVAGGPALLPVPVRSAAISGADPAPREFIQVFPQDVYRQMSVGFSLRIGPAFLPNLYITTDTVQILGAGGEFVVCQLACHPTYGLWVHTQAVVGSLVPIVPGEWYWVAMLYDGPNEVAKLRVYRISDWQFLGESALAALDQQIYAALYGRTDAIHFAVDDFFWYGVFAGRYDNTFPVLPGEAFAAPLVVSSRILPGGGLLEIVLNRPATAGIGGPGGFELALTGGPVTLEAVEGAGTARHIYQTSRVIDWEETGVLGFHGPGNGLQSNFGTLLGDFSNLPVSNQAGNPSGVRFVGKNQATGGNNIASGRLEVITLERAIINGCFLIGISLYDDTPPTLTATMNGLNLPVRAAGQISSGKGRVIIMGQAVGNLPAGQYEIALEWGGVGATLGYYSAGIICYEGVHQAQPFGNAVAAAVVGTTISVGLPSAMEEVVISALYDDSPGTIQMGGPLTTERHNRILDGIGFAMSEQAGVAAPDDTPVGFLAAGPSWLALAAVALRPAVAS